MPISRKYGLAINDLLGKITGPNPTIAKAFEQTQNVVNDLWAALLAAQNDVVTLATAITSLGTSKIEALTLTVPSWLTASGSPTSGPTPTIAITPTGSQTANRVLATPSGSPGAVGLRAITALDLEAAAADNTVITQGLTFSDNSPSGGSIAWTAGTLTLNGVTYAISAGNTANDLVYFAPATSTTVLQTANLGSNRVLPSLTSADYIIAWNSPYNSSKGYAAPVTDLHTTIGRVLYSPNTISVYSNAGNPSVVIVRSSTDANQPGVIQIYDGTGGAVVASLSGSTGLVSGKIVNVTVNGGLDLTGALATLGAKTLVGYKEFKDAGVTSWFPVYR